uniref:Histone deacetylase complex subunit SAP130 C-terminal domain-containing protein n=1 Tax=Dendroctonus ponderosae TaxID=77166 RepID=A0AAR5PK97_DENPD
MSGNPDDHKEPQKLLPLDLARAQMTAVRTVESSKAPLVMTSQALRNVRVLTQGGSAASSPISVGPTIITNLMPGAVIKQDPNKAQISTIVQSHSQSQPAGSISIQRPAQISLGTTLPIVAAPNPSGTSYHVPRGPAVVANLAAPRSNVTTVRTPLVVTAQNSQAHTFVRPARTPSPAQGAAWLTNSSNGSQIKGAPTVLSSPVRGATVTGKQPVAGRPQFTQQIPAIRSSTLLSNAITIGQTVHSFKPQLGNTVSISQVVPSRPQAVVYSANTGAQFTPAARITVATTAQNQAKPPIHPRPLGSIVSGPRLAVPISQVQNSRVITASQTSNLINQRIPVVSTSQPPHSTVLTSTNRLVTSQPSGNVVGRLTVNSAAVTSSNNILNQPRTSNLSTLNLQSLVAVANGGLARVQQTAQGPKVITQPAATIHLTQMPSQLKSCSSSVVTTTTRTINVPASIVSQRPNSGVPPQTLSISKVFASTENQINAGSSVFIQAPLQVQAHRHPVPSSQGASGPLSYQTVTSSVPSSTGPPYQLANPEGNAYFYDNSVPPAGAFQRSFVSQQSNAFVAQSQPQQVARTPANVGSQQFQGMRISSVMVVEQARGQQQNSAQFQPISSSQTVPEHQVMAEQTQQQQPVQNKITSSPRPTILRKRDHEGSPLKAAKNLTPVLQGMNQQQNCVQAPASPPFLTRPDSRGNGHSSGFHVHSEGSTTVSAASSPGLPEANEDSNPAVAVTIKEDEEESKPPMEMSPRKKPRKQQLTGNDIEENHDDMQFISESGVAKKETYDSDGPQSDSVPKDGGPEASRVTMLRKPATASLLNGYRQNWKATHNHYQRYSDVKPKDDRRPTIIDLANQNRVLDKVNGWKIYHLSTQMEDLEQCVYDQLTDLLKFTESEECSSRNDREVNRVNELIKGNLQRIKIINDGMLDAKCQIMKVFDHQRHVNDILNRCASKRNFKKRDKS